MLEEKISVIIPTYNVEAYIGRCLESCSRQTYQNLEFVVVDDGSTDKTLKICREYAEKDDRFKVIESRHGGLSHTRNVGLAAATGNFFGFLDSDDFIKEDFYQVLYELIVKYSADIAICDYYRGRFENLNSLPKSNQAHDICTFTKREMLENWHGKYTRVETVVWNKLYRRDVWMNSNGEMLYFPEGVLFEDTFMTHKIIDNAEKIAYTSQKLYVYYERKESIVNNSVSCQKVIDSMAAQNQRLQFFKNNGYEGAYTRLLLGMEKFRMMYIMKLDSTDQGKQMKKNLCRDFAADYESVVASGNVAIQERVILGLFRNTIGRVGV